MGYKLIKHLESAGFNRKLFYLDHGAQDLPPIVNKTDILPGSEARDLRTGDKWILDTGYRWIYVGDDDTLLPVDINEYPSTITEINILPSTVSVKPGSTIQFFAETNAGKNINPQVTWSISPKPTAEGTIIDYNGLLIVDEAELQNRFQVTATSLAKDKLQARAEVTVLHKQEEIDNLPDNQLRYFEISPAITTVVADWRNADNEPFRSVFNLDIAGYNIDIRDTAVFSAEVVGNTDENTTAEIITIGNLPKVRFTPGDHEHARAVKVSAYMTIDGQKYITTAIVHIEPRHTNKAIPWITKFDWSPAITDLIQGDKLTVPYKDENSFIQLAYIIEGVNDFDRTVRFDLTGAPRNSKAYIDLQNRLHFDVTGEYEVTAYPIGNLNLAKTLKVVASKNAATVKPSLAISPAAISIHQGARYTFVASGFGNEDFVVGLDKIDWAVKGATSLDTTITGQGVLTIGVGETASAVLVEAFGKEDPGLRQTSIVEILPVATKKDGTIEEVPVWPEHKEYIRHMNHNGIAEWRPTHFVPVEDFDARRSEKYSKLLDRITVDANESRVQFTIDQYDPIPRKHSTITMDLPVSHFCEIDYPNGQSGSMSGNQAEQLQHLFGIFNGNKYLSVDNPDADKIELTYTTEKDGNGNTYRLAHISIKKYAEWVLDRFQTDERDHIHRNELSVQKAPHLVRYLTDIEHFADGNNNIFLRLHGYHPVNKAATEDILVMPMATTEISGFMHRSQVANLEDVYTKATRSIAVTTGEDTLTLRLQGLNNAQLNTVTIPAANGTISGLLTTALHGQIQSNTDRVKGVEDRAAELEGRASGFDASIASLQAEDRTLQSNITALQNNINEKFTKIQDEIVSKLDSGIKTMNANLTTMDGSIKKLDESFTGYKTYVATTYAVADGNATQTWVNTQLNNYTTTNALQNLITSSSTLRTALDNRYYTKSGSATNITSSNFATYLQSNAATIRSIVNG